MSLPGQGAGQTPVRRVGTRITEGLVRTRTGSAFGIEGVQEARDIRTGHYRFMPRDAVHLMLTPLDGVCQDYAQDDAYGQDGPSLFCLMVSAMTTTVRAPLRSLRSC